MSSHAELVQALVSQAEGPNVAYPRTATIAEIFAAQAARTPDRTALIAGGRTFTYRELDAVSNQWARYLIRCGVGPEVCVGVAMERSPEMLIALLAVLKAGGAYVPLDPSYPAARIRFIAEDAAMPVALVSPSARPLLNGAPARLICPEEAEGAAAIAAQSLQPLERRGDGTNLAYVIYTSGSTGTPKGVMVEHRNVLSFAAAMDRLLGTEPGVWLAVTSICFDISVLELLWTLLRGFTVVLHTGEGAEGIAQEMRQYGVTHFQSTPSLARLLALDAASLAALSGLKALLLGGETLPAALVRRLRQTVRGEIFNMYGPTETTIWSLAHRVSEPGATVPIGTPLANTQVYVLDAQSRPVAMGESGELYIGGDGVARGYWKQPQLTAGRFPRDPFGPAPDAHLYRTGDLARFLPDGSLDFLGRADAQVKVRGFRIELGEIEAALEALPAVQQAVMTAHEVKPGDQRLIAYVVLRPAQWLRPDELRQRLADWLPAFMMPAHVVFLEAFPLTANGKIDRRALALRSLGEGEPPRGAESAAAPDAPPHSPALAANRSDDLEELIVRVWRDALGSGEIGRTENFFDLGAHSLMVAEVHMELQRTLGRTFPLLDLFQFPTVAALARHWREPADRAVNPAVVPSPSAAATRAARRLERRAALAGGLERNRP